MADNNTEKQKKGFFRPWMLVIIIALVIAVPALVNMLLKNGIAKIMGKVGTPVTVETAVKGSLTQELEISGSLASEEIRSYYSPVTCVISSCDLKTGDTVSSGEKLVSFDVEGLEEQLNEVELQKQVSLYGSDIAIKSVDYASGKAAEAAKDYEEAKAYVAHYNEVVGNLAFRVGEATKLQKQQAEVAAEVDALTKALEKDPTDKKTAKQLAKKSEKLKEITKKVKEADIDGLNSAYQQASADLAEYKALEQQYEAQKESDPTASLQKKQQAVSKQIAEMSTDSLEETIEKAKKGINADFDGVVVASAAAGGMGVSEGMELFQIADTSRIKVVIAAGKSDLEKLQKGQKAKVKVLDKEYDAHVSDIGRIANVSSTGSVTVDVDLHIDNPDDSIILGTEGKCTIQTAEKNDIVLVPMVCLNYSSDSTFVYLVKDGKLVKSVVETGISDDEMIEITSGVQEGDEVAKNVTSEMTEGMDATAVHEKDEDKDKDGKDDKKN